VRIKELADLAGTTVRTIRYYHEIGLLPVPAVRDGRRDYALVHVARLIRIRWLAEAGVPLSRVASLLPAAEGADPVPPRSADADRASILTDLRATAVALEDQLARLEAQRDQVHRLIGSVERDDHLSPMPAAIVRFYDDMERRAGSEQVRRVVRSERAFEELAFFRGDMPPEVEVGYQGFDDERLAESLAVFGQVATRGEQAAMTAAELDDVAAAVTGRLRRHLGPDLPQVARAIDRDAARRAAELFVRLADGPERALARKLADAVIAVLEEGRSA
jgi:DNA-binding transcriptional MerR regulator